MDPQSVTRGWKTIQPFYKPEIVSDKIDLTRRSDLQPVTNLRARKIDGVSRKLQHTRCLQGNPGNSERADMFFDVYDLFVLVQEYEVNRE
jgi:hypothetical protein